MFWARAKSLVDLYVNGTSIYSGFRISEVDGGVSNKEISPFLVKEVSLDSSRNLIPSCAKPWTLKQLIQSIKLPVACLSNKRKCHYALKNN